MQRGREKRELYKSSTNYIENHAAGSEKQLGHKGSVIFGDKLGKLLEETTSSQTWRKLCTIQQWFWKQCGQPCTAVSKEESGRMLEDWL